MESIPASERMRLREFSRRKSTSPFALLDMGPSATASTKSNTDESETDKRASSVSLDNEPQSDDGLMHSGSDSLSDTD